MKAEKLEIPIYAELKVTDETADRCLRILEMWMDDHPHETIICDLVPTQEGHRHRFRREEIHTPAETEGGRHDEGTADDI